MCAACGGSGDRPQVYARRMTTIRRTPASARSAVEAQPLFPPAHAFVVQFGGDAETPAANAAGRVEHVVSGRSERFAGAESLFAFIDRMRRTAATT